MASLYIVSTPIGNLQDITFRAVKILESVKNIACEDTRKTGFLLKALNINRGQDLISYYEENESVRIPQILNVLINGEDVSLVSDAGTPAISDPGFRLIRECVNHGIKVESIPGPSAVISALVVSGLPTDKFLFLGYPPAKPGHRKKFFENITLMIRIIRVTVIIYEAPHKLIKTLGEMKEAFGDIDIVICRELTKIHEEIRREKISDSLAYFQKINPKGEFVVLFNYAKPTFL